MSVAFCAFARATAFNHRRIDQWFVALNVHQKRTRKPEVSLGWIMPDPVASRPGKSGKSRWVRLAAIVLFIPAD